MCGGVYDLSYVCAGACAYVCTWKLEDNFGYGSLGVVQLI